MTSIGVGRRPKITLNIRPILMYVMIFLFHFLAVLLSYFSFVLDLPEEEVLYQLILCLLLIRRFPCFITTVFPLSLSSSPPQHSKLTAAGPGPQQRRPGTSNGETE